MPGAPQGTGGFGATGGEILRGCSKERDRAAPGVSPGRGPRVTLGRATPEAPPRHPATEVGAHRRANLPDWTESYRRECLEPLGLDGGGLGCLAAQRRPLAVLLGVGR